MDQAESDHLDSDFEDGTRNDDLDDENTDPQVPEDIRQEPEQVQKVNRFQFLFLFVCADSFFDKYSGS